MNVKNAFSFALAFAMWGSLIPAAAGAETLGSAEYQRATPDWVGESNVKDAHYGSTVSTAGDVNGDGYDDIIVGASNYANGQSQEGAVYFYHGSESGVYGTPDFVIEGNAALINLGYSVSTAGDVNGDGYDDVIMGAPLFTDDLYREGAAFVYYGSAGGLSSTPDWIMTGTQNTERFGTSVSCAGDVNGDGYDDVIIGANTYKNGEDYEGGAFVFHGSQTGLSNSPDWTGEGNQAACFFGNYVSNAGDVDGDGYDDVIVGANFYNNGETNEGRAFLFYGSASGLESTAGWTAEGNAEAAEFGHSVSTAGDVNNDGYDDVIVGAYGIDIADKNEGKAFVYYGSENGLSASPGWIGEGGISRAQFGFWVSTAGDFNADGFDDVIIGATQDYYDEENEGIAYIFYGSATGLSAVADWNAEGNQVGALFGYSVSIAGDVNGDGGSDVIIGAELYDNGESNEGAAFVFHGTPSGSTPLLDDILNALLGLVSSQMGYDLNGDGVVDAADLVRLVIQ
ncbi:integrin alpha [bacterium]|nr:integrin alpha [bacterium]